MIVLNFAHPLTEEQLHQIEALAGRTVEQIIVIDAQVDPGAPLAPQVAAMVDRVGLSAEEWQTLPLLIALPSLNYSAGVLLAELHGRMGYFPSILRLRPVPGVVPPRFEVVEIIDLQAVRDAARARRGRAQAST
ncbi:MAG: CRISPR-associated protein Csx15 [Thermoflexus sp.]